MMNDGELASNSLRLFIALPLPSLITRHLLQLPQRGLDARWQHADDLHITLRFLGDVPKVQEPKIIAALQTVRRPCFGVEMAGLGIFAAGRHHILHAAIISTRKINTLCADITDALTPLGFDFSQRPYVPHITLARLNRLHALDDYIARHGGAVRGQWTAPQFSLFESRTDHTRRYTARASFLLN